MLSRVANSIYWLSRYMERADNVARFIDVNLQMMLDLPSGSREQWQPLVSISGDDAEFSAKYPVATRDNVIKFLRFARENPNSIVSCLRAARENARTIRESIAPEMWEQVNSSYLMANAAASNELLRSLSSFFSEVKKASQLFHGITDATLSHGEEWHFYRMGRLLERADKASRLLDVKYFMLLPSVTDVGTPLDDIQWAAVLRSASALEMYRKRHGHIAPEQIINFLVLDHEFPRSIHYCLTAANDSLHAISGTPIGMYRNPAEQRLGQLRSELAYTDMRPVFLELHHLRIHPRCDGVQNLTYFDSKIEPRPSGSTDGIDIDGNVIANVWFQGLTEILVVESQVKVITQYRIPFHYILAERAERLPVSYLDPIKAYLAPYTVRQSESRYVEQFARHIANMTEWKTLRFLTMLTREISEGLQQTSRRVRAPRSAEETYLSRTGSSRDLAVLFMDACRYVGIAARFVNC